MAKALVQKAISFLPDPQRANYFFQSRVTHSTTLTPEVLDQRVGWAAMHLDAFDRHGGDRSRFVAVELGSGWYPIIPLCMYLAGAETVYMVDLEDLGRPELAVQAMNGLLDAHSRDELGSLGKIEGNRIDRLRETSELVQEIGHIEALARLGIRVRPGDARTLTLSEVPQLIWSNTVLEHILPDVLEGILARFVTLSGTGTIMSHLVDHLDHYAYVDDSVSLYNFLRFSDRTWKLIDNGVQPMNRLRASQYVDMYNRLGIPLTEEEHRDCEPLNLVGIPLDDRFKAMDPADVACAASYLVTKFD